MTEPRPAPPGRQPAAVLSDPTERGRLRIAPLVLRRIAEHTATNTPGTTGRQRRGGSRQVTARVRANGSEVALDLDVALVYPRPIGEIVRELRRRVSAEIGRLTGYRVRTVQVTVSALLPAVRPRVE